MAHRVQYIFIPHTQPLLQNSGGHWPMHNLWNGAVGLCEWHTQLLGAIQNITLRHNSRQIMRHTRQIRLSDGQAKTPRQFSPGHHDAADVAQGVGAARS